ncbi:MAG TPA: glycosyltransferase family 4 protein [Candidatus Thermoplasmatota archaeon]|nr:glycosyltransferase family 4 protein [Candidatus Thermoplasmatota archaeon]
MSRRLLVVAPSALPHVAGVQRVTWDLASGLRMRRWDVTLLTTGVPGRPREFERDGLHVLTVPANRARASGRRWEAATQKLVRGLGLESFDALIGAGPAGEAIPIHPTRRSPLVFQCPDTAVGCEDPDAGPWRRRRPGASLRPQTLRRLARELVDLERADAVVVPQPRVKEALSRWPYRAVPNARRARVVRNGVDSRRFHPHPRAGPAWRRRHRIGEEAPLVFTACRLEGSAGVQDALGAFRVFQRANPGAKYVIAGAGPALGALKQRVQDLGLGGSVAFTGSLSLPMVVRWLQAADLCLFLPRGPNVKPPVTLLESLACGPDVVAASTALDLALPHSRIHAVRPCDPPAAARALQWAWGQRGIRHDAPFPEAWTLGHCVRGYEAVLREAMDAHGLQRRPGRSSRLNGGLLSAGTGSVGDRLRRPQASLAAAAASGPPR